jgi:hypothetical protein
MRKKNKYVFFLTILFVIIISIYIFHSKRIDDESSKQKAVIIDGLLGYPNLTFITKATNLLNSAGYKCDVIDPEDVTVELYQNLLTEDYSLIVLRVHCGPLRKDLGDGYYVPEGTAFFTTEIYDTKKYVKLQDRGLLAVARIQGDDENRYFAIPPWFFEEMGKSFVNTTIILDSCYGFWYDAPLIMAETLMQKGVTMFIGWNGEVQVEHTDAAVLKLIESLYQKKLSVDEAVSSVMRQIGPDPYYGSRLYYYPEESGNLILQK